MVRRLLKWARLPSRERRRVARVISSLLWIKISQHTSRLSLGQGASAETSEGLEEQGASEARLAFAQEYVAALQQAVSGLPFSTTCLERSTALRRILRSKGVETDLRIGVRRGDEGLEAHAWLELGGTVLNDSEDVHERYAAFTEPVLPSNLEIRG